MNSPEQPPTGPRRVLAVDDEEIVLVALRDTLRQQGYEVTTAENATQGIGLLQRERFAVVLTDQMMPGLTGLEFLAQSRVLQPEASRILITAVLNVSTVIEAVNKAEIFRFILKPWQRDDLLSAIQAGLDRHQTILQERQRLTDALAEAERLRHTLSQLRR